MSDATPAARGWSRSMSEQTMSRRPSRSRTDCATQRVPVTSSWTMASRRAPVRAPTAAARSRGVVTATAAERAADVLAGDTRLHHRRQRRPPVVGAVRPDDGGRGVVHVGEGGRPTESPLVAEGGVDVAIRAHDRRRPEVGAQLGHHTSGVLGGGQDHVDVMRPADLGDPAHEPAGIQRRRGVAQRAQARERAPAGERGRDAARPRRGTRRPRASGRPTGRPGSRSPGRGRPERRRRGGRARPS